MNKDQKATEDRQENQDHPAGMEILAHLVKKANAARKDQQENRDREDHAEKSPTITCMPSSKC